MSFTCHALSSCFWLFPRYFDLVSEKTFSNLKNENAHYIAHYYNYWIQIITTLYYLVLWLVNHWKFIIMLCQRLVQLFCDLKNPNASELPRIQYGKYHHFCLLSVIVDLFQVLCRRSAENDLSQLQDPTGNANRRNSICLIFGKKLHMCNRLFYGTFWSDFLNRSQSFPPVNLFGYVIRLWDVKFRKYHGGK